MTLTVEYNQTMERYQTLLTQKSFLENTLNVSLKKMQEIEEEQSLLERSTLAIQAVKPLLTQSSIKDCEDLANAAIQAVFGFEAKIRYSPDRQRFVMDQGDFSTDLANAEGGGLVTPSYHLYFQYIC